MDTQTYQSYKGLPSLAGICTMTEAAKPGLSVEECVRRLKRYHYAYKRLHQIFMAHIASEPIYELKMGFSLHSYLCAEQVSALAECTSCDTRSFFSHRAEKGHTGRMMAVIGIKAKKAD